LSIHVLDADDGEPCRCISSPTTPGKERRWL
jgi:hypothetical protein